jgi:transposase-like protein
MIARIAPPPRVAGDPASIPSKVQERADWLISGKYLNNIVEQDHRRMKRLIGPGLGFGGFWTARRTLAGYEAMAMMRKGQVRNIGGSDIRGQARFISGLFEVVA